MNNLQEIEQFKELDNLQLIAKFVVEGFITGLHKSPYHGFSVEFAEHRLYNTGESIRHIDWKLFARTEKLFVKKYEEETNLRTQFVLDVSPSMLFPKQQFFNKLNFSIVSISALIYMLRRQRDAMGLTLFSDQVHFHTEAKLNTTHIQLIYSKLQDIYDKKLTFSSKKTSVANTLHQVAESIHKRSLVIIFSDMLQYEQIDDVFNALQHLRHNKHEVILFYVFEKNYEYDFEFSNRPYKFIDLETQQVLKLNPNQVRDYYKQKMKDFFEQLKLKCGQYNIDIVEADINQNFKDVLIQYLIKRQKLF